MAPIEHRTTDKAFLFLKYTNEGWPERLLEYHEDPPQLFGRKTLRVWRDSDGDVKCRILEYANPVDRQVVIRQLKDDDGVMWHIL